MTHAHELILIGGLLGVAAIFAGLVSTRLGAPILLVFLGIGIAAGEDGPGGILFSDFDAAYLIGSIALAAILFEGGLKTERAMLRAAFWPSATLATVGVALSCGIVAAAAALVFGIPWTYALLIGAALAPTDAAAVGLVLRPLPLAIPHRLSALLEIESGLNDPMSVFLTVALVTLMTTPGSLGAGHAALLFAEEMGGGAALGLAAGYGLLALLRRLPADAPIFPILAWALVLTLFGAAQMLGASGFLAVYLTGVVLGTHRYQTRARLEEFFEAFSWLAQIALFLMLGLLLTPHSELPSALPIAVVTAVLVLLARPVAVFACLLPFGYGWREAAFASWVGLRGAVPIFLTTIPVLAGVAGGEQLFGFAFGVVVVSLVVQGWTVGLAARLLGFAKIDRGDE